MQNKRIKDNIILILISNCILIILWIYLYNNTFFPYRDWIYIIKKKNYPNKYFSNEKLLKILKYQEKYTEQLELFRKYNLLNKIFNKPIFRNELNYYNSYNGSKIWKKMKKISNNSNFIILLSGYHTMTNILTYSFYNGYLNLTQILEKEIFNIEYIENLFILYRIIFHTFPLIKPYININENFQKEKNITSYENLINIYIEIFNIKLIESIIFLFDSIIEKYENINQIKFFSNNEIKMIILSIKNYKKECYICYKYMKNDFEGLKVVNKLLNNEFITNIDIIKYFSILYRISKSINFIKIIDNLLNIYQNKLSMKLTILNIICFFIIILINLLLYQYIKINNKPKYHNIFKKNK